MQKTAIGSALSVYAAPARRRGRAPSSSSSATRPVSSSPPSGTKTTNPTAACQTNLTTGDSPALEVGETMIVGIALSVYHRFPQVRRTRATRPVTIRTASVNEQSDRSVPHAFRRLSTTRAGVRRWGKENRPGSCAAVRVARTNRSPTLCVAKDGAAPSSRESDLSGGLRPTVRFWQMRRSSNHVFPQFQKEVRK
jgi:hypothetical protein